uniref:Nuclear condensin complex subunit 3 C-terminal domain-containing protein n=1 Tax=Tetradesmus obliquus TaxID=3088 RepID=A0A383VSX8_TETOB|eukprot:jgi/Sobl393_1/17140/SZX68281.1
MPSAVTVGQLLNSAQDSAAAADRCAGSLWKLAVADPDGTYEELRRCVDHLVTLGQKSTYVERCVRFFGAFAAKTPADNEAAAAVVEELLSHLSRHLSALDKAVRYRSAQLLQQLLSGVPASLLLEDLVAELLRDSLQERLHDKLPAVRAEACRALSHLVSEDEDGQAIVAAMLQLLDTDKSKDVRIAVLQSLPLDAASLPVLLERARDVNPLVRKALVVRLKGLPIKLVSIKQRAEVIQQLLQDRDAAVADAGAKLLSHWLEKDCGGDPLQLLQLLDVETYTDAAALAVESLINSGSIGGSSGVTGYVDAASRSSPAELQAGTLLGLRALAEQQEGQQEQQLLMPHEALMWRCLCEWLRSDAISKGLAAAATGGARAAVQAAVAAERHEVLERALPESAGQLMGLVMQHAAAGPAVRFAAAQLMIIASSCVEWVDAASRSMAAPYLQQLIGLDPQAEAEQEDEPMSDDDEAADAAAAGLQLAGNGGEGLFEAAVTQLVLAVQGAGAGFTVAMLDGVAPLAAAAGLLAKPGGEAGAAAAAVTVCVAEPSQVLQCLAYIKLLLQQLPSGRPVPDEGAAVSFDSLWETLLLLALKQEQPEIRAKAVECIGLYAMAGASRPWLLTSAVQLLGPLLLADSCYATKRAAVRALTDLALLLRPAAVDAVLRGPGAAAASTAAAAAGEEAGDTAGSSAAAAAAADDGVSSGLSRGLLELLLEQAEVLLAEAQATAAKPKRGGRPTSASKAEAAPLPAATAELLAAVAESLCKLLLHQRAWLRHYEHYAPAAAPAAAAAGGSSDVEHSATPPPPAAAAATCAAPFPPGSRQQQARLLRRALALLLQLQFHPATEAAIELRQCLSVFFDVFTAANAEFRLQLVAAVMPAARQALHVVCKKNPAALLVKYVLQLLQATDSGDAEQQQATAGAVPTLLGDSYDSLALQLLGEVEAGAPLLAAKVQPAKFKPYLSAVLKLYACGAAKVQLPRFKPYLSAVLKLYACGAAKVQFPRFKPYLSAVLKVRRVLQPWCSAAKVQPAKFKPHLSAVLKVVCELPLHPAQPHFECMQRLACFVKLRALTGCYLLLLQLLLLQVVVCELPLHPAQPHFECMQRLADRLALAVSDATLKKEVGLVQLLLGRVLQEAGSSQQQQQLPAEALDLMIEQMQEMCLRELKPMPGSAAAAGDEAAAAAATPAAPRTTRKAAAAGSRSVAGAPRTAQRRAAGKSKAAAVSSSDDEDEESFESSATESDDDSGDEGHEDSSRARAEEAAAQKTASAVAAPAAVGKADVAAAAAALGKAGSRRSSATARQPLAPTTVDNSQQ